MDKNFSLKVMDFDHKNATSQLIGQLDTNLVELTQPATLKLKNKKITIGIPGKLTIIEAVPFYNYDHHHPFHIAQGYNVKLRATKVKRSDIGLTKQGRSSDPYIKILAVSYNSVDFVQIHATEHLKNAREGEWQPFRLNVDQCGGIDAPIKIQMYDYDDRTKHDYLGETMISLRAFGLHLAQNQPFPLFNKTAPSKAAAKKRKAIVHVVSFTPI